MLFSCMLECACLFLSGCGCVYVSVLVCNFVQLVQLMHVYI